MPGEEGDYFDFGVCIVDVCMDILPTYKAPDSCLKYVPYINAISRQRKTTTPHENVRWNVENIDRVVLRHTRTPALDIIM